MIAMTENAEIEIFDAMARKDILGGNPSFDTEARERGFTIDDGPCTCTHGADYGHNARCGYYRER